MKTFTASVLIASTLLAFLSCSDAETESNTANAVASDTVTHSVDTLVTSTPEINSNATLEYYAFIKTKEDLIQTFGSEALTDGSSWFAEGTIELQHTVVKDPKTGFIIKYLWQEDNPKKLNGVEVSYYEWNEDYGIDATQVIHSEEGLFTGMTLEQLIQWNGADFTFSGFGWDYAGNIFRDQGSKISNSKLVLNLMLNEHEHPGDYSDFYGDIEFSSSDPAVLKAPIIVERMTYYVGE